MCVCVCVRCHPRADYFVVSKLFSVAKQVGSLKLGSKPAQVYVVLSIISLSHQVNHPSLGIIMIIMIHYVVAFVCLHFALPNTRVLNSIEKLSMNVSGSCYSPSLSLSLYIYIYIYIYIYHSPSHSHIHTHTRIFVCVSV